MRPSFDIILVSTYTLAPEFDFVKKSKENGKKDKENARIGKENTT